jgi:endonuclease/exonuclease/phosphatase family metal-dependent hydrolase
MAWRRERWVLVISALLLVAVIGRCAPSVVSLPADGEPVLRVAAWNMLSANNAADRVLAGLAGVDVDLVGLEELRIEAARAVEEDPLLGARYPYRALFPEQTVLGVGLLSRHPITEQQSWADPPLLRAVVDPDASEPVTVFVAHPLPAPFQSFARVPLGLDTRNRDADIAFIRSQIDADLAAGRQVVVLGDFNVTEREPAYADLSAGLGDAHLNAGVGPGLSWRPPALRGLPFGLLRIDYVLSSSGYVAVGSSVDCSAPSDHCIVFATLGQRGL